MQVLQLPAQFSQVSIQRLGRLHKAHGWELVFLMRWSSVERCGIIAAA